MSGAYEEALRTVEETLGVTARRDGQMSLDVAASWSNQWGAAYGGFVAGALLHALERNAPDGQYPTSVYVRFLRPVKAGPAEIAVSVGRVGGSATPAEAQLDQFGELAATASAWLTVAAEPDRTRLDIERPQAESPAGLPPAPEPEGHRTVAFTDAEFDIRPVAEAASDDPVRRRQWFRLKRLDLAPADRLPLAAIGLVADMVGAGPYRAGELLHGTPHALLSLDLILQIVRPAKGAWLLGELEAIAIDNGRSIGHAALFDGNGDFVCTVAQQCLLRPFR